MGCNERWEFRITITCVWYTKLRSKFVENRNLVHKTRCAKKFALHSSTARDVHSSAQPSIIFIHRPVSLLGRRTTYKSIYISIYRTRRRLLVHLHPSSVCPVEHECAAPVADRHSWTWWANRPYICFRTVSTRGRITRDKNTKSDWFIRQSSRVKIDMFPIPRGHRYPLGASNVHEDKTSTESLCGFRCSLLIIMFQYTSIRVIICR